MNNISYQLLHENRQLKLEALYYKALADNNLNPVLICDSAFFVHQYSESILRFFEPKYQLDSNNLSNIDVLSDALAVLEKQDTHTFECPLKVYDSKKYQASLQKHYNTDQEVIAITLKLYPTSPTNRLPNVEEFFAQFKNQEVIIYDGRELLFASPLLAKALEIVPNQSFNWRKSAINVFQDDRELLINRLERHYKGETVPDVFDFRYVASENEIHWIEVRSERLSWNSRTFSVHFFKDISLRKKHLLQLTKNEERAQLAFEAANEGMWDWDIASNKVYFSKRYFTMLGYYPFEFQPSYNSWLQLLHPDDQNIAHASIKKALLDQSRDFSIEFRMRKKNGAYIWILARGRIIKRDKQKKAERVIGTHLDISQLKNLHKKLTDNKLKWNWLSEHKNLGMAIFSVNQQVNLKEYNLAFADYVQDALKNANVELEKVAELEMFKNIPFSDICNNADAYSYSDIVKDQKRKFVVTTLKINESEIAILLTNINEARDIAKEVSDQEQILQQIFDKSNTGYLLIEASKTNNNSLFHIIDVNNVWLQITGNTKARIVGKEISVVFQNNDIFRELLETVSRTREEMQFDYFDNLMQKYFEVFIFSFKDGQIVISLKDISQRKLQNLKLEAGEEQYKQLTDNKEAVMWICELQDPPESSPILYINNLGKQMFGLLTLQESDLQFSDLFREIIPEDKSKLINLLKTTEFGRNADIDATIRLQNRDNLPVWMWIRTFPIYNEWEHIYRFGGIATNVSAIKMAETALHKSESHLKAMLDSSPHIYFLINPEMKIVTFNATAKDFFRKAYNREIKLNMPIYELISGKEYQIFEQHFNEALAGKPVSLQTEIILNSSNFVWFDVSYYPVYETDKELYGVSYTALDISAQKKIETELKRAKEKAEQGDKLKSEFLSNMSHEIRTPMNAIIGFSELLNDEVINEEHQEYLSIIHNSSKHLLVLINDIIDISKIEAGQLQVNQVNINLNSLLTDIYNFFKRDLKLKKHDKVKLVLNKSVTDIESQIFTDEVRLRQILDNLIGNAIKFTENGYIEFGYQLVSDNLQFYVKDTGLGLTNEQKKTIFERFRQADGSITRNYGGTGLGLAITRGLIHLLGGGIWLESVYGKGTTFYFTIPYLPKNRKVHESGFAEEFSLSPYYWKHKTLLIADNDNQQLMQLKHELSPTHIGIISTDNAHTALEICKYNQNIDIIIINDELLKEQPDEILRAIKHAQENEIYIFLQITNTQDLAAMEEFTKLKSDEIVKKPIEMAELLRLINRYLSE